MVVTKVEQVTGQMPNQDPGEQEGNTQQARTLAGPGSDSVSEPDSNRRIQVRPLPHDEQNDGFEDNVCEDSEEEPLWLASEEVFEGRSLNLPRKTPPGTKVRMKKFVAQQHSKEAFQGADQVDSVVMETFVECCGCLRSDIRPKMLRFIFLLVVALAFLFSGIVLRFSVFRGNELEAVEGDMIVLPASTYFCKSMTVKSSNKINVNILPHLPNISKTKKNYNVGKEFVIGSWTYQFWKFHLIKHTTIKIGICADQYVMFYMIKGDKNLTFWKQTTLFYNYYKTMRILPKQHCTAKNDFVWLALDIEDTDMYCIMFSSSVGWRFVTKVSTYLEFSRAVYDVTDAKHSCDSVNNSTHKDKCTLLLDYASNDMTVVEFKPKSGTIPDPFDKVKIEWDPQPREVLYFTLFGGTYAVVIVLTILYTLWRFVAYKMRKEKETVLLLSYDRTYYQHKAKIKGRKRKPSPWVVCIADDERSQDADQKFSLLGDSYEIEKATPTLRGASSEETLTRTISLAADYTEDHGYTQTQQAVDASMTIAGISAI